MLTACSSFRKETGMRNTIEIQNHMHSGEGDLIQTKNRQCYVEAKIMANGNIFYKLLTNDYNCLICCRINTSLTLLLVMLVESLRSNTLPHVSIDFLKKGNVKDMTKYRDVNEHLKVGTEVIESNCLLSMENNIVQPVFLGKIEDITLCRSQFQITSFINCATLKMILVHLQKTLRD